MLAEAGAVGSMRAGSNQFPVANSVHLVRLLMEIGAIEDARRKLEELGLNGPQLPEAAENQELVELRAELCDKQAKESKGGPYSTFDFGHPAVMAIRSAENAAMVRRANLWNEFKDGWLAFSFSGVDPGYVVNSRDRRTGEMVLEGVLTHVSDGIRRPAKLRMPDNDAERLAILMGSEYGHGRCGKGTDASA